MSNLIAASFTNEAQAIEALHKLVELESSGDITIYERAIVKKDLNGKATVLQTEVTDGRGTLPGMAIGTLVGALAGPVGLLAGLITGTVAGAIFGSSRFNFPRDFTSKLKKQVQPGTAAVIAEIDEDSPVFVNNALAPLGATISRANMDYTFDEYIEAKVDEIDERITAERAKIKSAAGTERSRIQQKMARLKEKRKQRIAG